MNWYKIASKNIKLDKQLMGLVIEIASEMIKFYGKQFEIEYLGKEEFINQYTNRKQEISVFVLGKKIDAIAVYSPESLILNVYPNSLITHIKDKGIILEYFRQAIYHELVHAVDPSMIFLKRDVSNSGCDYYSSPYEFNAYSSQISEDILYNFKTDKSILEDIKQWLRFDKNYPLILKPYDKIIDCWRLNDNDNGTKYLRMFKQKLYELCGFLLIKEE